ncbi:cytochrome P450 [Actinomadura flavalba]|uniref:cytochrome P450 n=1 Tax=Actinomadura flavalba TaxID=1120938 RepID=UPI0003797049|nr:cytochrome P450 [Actinomadura flavalba]
MTATAPPRASGIGKTPPGTSVSEAPKLLRQLVFDRLGMMTDAARRGDAVRLVIGPRTMYFFNHPDHAKHVLADNPGNYHKGVGLRQARRALGDGLLTSEGALWREQRSVVRPAFQSRRINAQADVVAQEAAHLVERLRAQTGRGPVDVVHEMTGLTLGVLGRTLLDADLGAHSSLAGAFEAVQDQAMFEMVTQGVVPLWSPLPKQVRFRRARRELDRVVGLLAAERTVEGGDDALSRLLVSVRKESDRKLAARRLRDELVTLLLAGHETTASTLGWSFYLLDRHPEVQRRLRAEVREVLGDRTPTFEDLHRMPYTHAVLQEVMRLYPPVWLLSRISQEDDVVGGYHVPAGRDVLVSPYAMHRNQEFWGPDAESFDPSRFEGSGAAQRPKYAYLPFGAGPRFCVGNQLGMMEAAFVLAMVLRDLRLTKVPEHRVVAEPMLSLRVRGGLPMTVHAA